MANISQINGLNLTAESASYAGTASLAPNYVLNNATSSFITSTQTSSFVLTSQTSSISVATASYISPTFISASAAASGFGSGGSTNTGSLLTTASVSSNTITFTKGDGSTFPITVDTGSGTSSNPVYAKNTGSFSSSGTGNQILTSLLIPANTFTAGDIVRVTARFKKVGTTSTTQTNILINTSVATAGATTLKANVYTASTLASTVQGSAVIINSTTNTQLPWNATNLGPTELVNSTSAWQESVAINWTTNQYILFTAAPNSASDTVSIIFYLIEKL